MSTRDRRPIGQWRDAAGAIGLRAGSMVLSDNGGWAVDTAGATPDGYLQLDANGAPSVDDAATSGAKIRIRTANTRIQGIS